MEWLTGMDAKKNPFPHEGKRMNTPFSLPTPALSGSGSKGIISDRIGHPCFLCIDQERFCQAEDVIINGCILGS